LDTAGEDITIAMCLDPVIDILAAAIASVIQRAGTAESGHQSGAGDAIIGEEAEELVIGIIYGSEVIRPAGLFIILSRYRTDAIIEAVYSSSELALISSRGRTGIGGLNHFLKGEDKSCLVAGSVDYISAAGAWPAAAMQIVGPSSGRAGKGKHVIKINMDYGQRFRHGDIESRQRELIEIGYGHRYLLFNILQKVAQYVNGILMCTSFGTLKCTTHYLN